MRRVLRLVISLGVALAVAWILRDRLQPSKDHPQARLDRGVAGEEGRARIDPHGPASDRPTSPFSLEARIEGTSASEYRVEVQLASTSAFDSVSVQAERFDRADALEASWSGVVWSGLLEPNVDTRFEARVPIGGTTPVRLQMRAQAISADGARHTATAILRPEASSP
jgi:hypothetical protein